MEDHLLLLFQSDNGGRPGRGGKAPSSTGIGGSSELSVGSPGVEDRHFLGLRFKFSNPEARGRILFKVLEIGQYRDSYRLSGSDMASSVVPKKHWVPGSSEESSVGKPTVGKEHRFCHLRRSGPKASTVVGNASVVLVHLVSTHNGTGY